MEAWNLEDKVIDDKSKDYNLDKFRQFMEYTDGIEGEILDEGEDSLDFQLKLSYMGVEYDCIISILFGGKSLTIQLVAKGKMFLTVHIHKKTSELQTTGIDIPLLPNMNKLQTVMKLKEKIFCFFNLDGVLMSDAASVMCDSYNEYNLILYRILATNKSLDEISLYKKFGFKYMNQESENKRMKSLLEEIRNTPIRELAPYFKSKPYYKSMLSNESIHEFFTQMCPVNKNCNDCREMIDKINDALYEPEEDFFQKLEALKDYCMKLIQNYSC